MNEEFISDSESEDIDYVPDEKEENDSFSSNDEDEEEEEDKSLSDASQFQEQQSSLRRTKTKRRKRRKLNEDEENSDSQSSKLDEAKSNIDAIWAAFQNDVTILSNRRSVMSGLLNGDDNSELRSDASSLQRETNDGEMFKRINENGTVEQADKASGGNPEISGSAVDNKKPQRPPKVPGLMAVINQLEKKNKFSILDRSKSDWNSFKSKEGISSTLESYNKGRRGYLDRQEFLTRTDKRRFEIEKNARSRRRTRQSL